MQSLQYGSRDPDEVGRQDQLEGQDLEDQQPGLVRLGSLLKNNMEVEAEMEMQRHLDETDVHIVCTI
jgi:hypothetical protein